VCIYSERPQGEFVHLVARKLTKSGLRSLSRHFARRTMGCFGVKGSIDPVLEHPKRPSAVHAPGPQEQRHLHRPRTVRKPPGLWIRRLPRAHLELWPSVEVEAYQTQILTQRSKFVNGIPPCRIEKNRGGDGSGSGTGFQFPAQKILQLLWSSISPCCLTACPAPPTVDNVSKTYNVYCSGPDRRIGMQWYLRRGPRLCGRVGRTEARRTGGSIPSRSEQQDQDVRAQTHAQASEVRDDEQRGVVIDISGGGSTQC
jgi:hypothetical protein